MTWKTRIQRVVVMLSVLAALAIASGADWGDAPSRLLGF